MVVPLYQESLGSLEISMGNNMRLFLILSAAFMMNQSLASNLLTQNDLDSTFAKDMSVKSLIEHEKQRELGYQTLEQVNSIVIHLNSFYQKHKTYPSASFWVEYIDSVAKGITVNLDDKIVFDAFGSPIAYMPISQHEVWIYSHNIFDTENDTEVKIYKLTRGG